MSAKKIEIICAYLAAILFVQTLYYKFGGHPDSVYIFTRLGMEPFGRIGIGTFELIASIALIIPKTRLAGALLGIMILFGAIFSHIFVLGLEVQNDSGKLFTLAIITMICCLLILRLRFSEFKLIISKYSHARDNH